MPVALLGTLSLTFFTYGPTQTVPAVASLRGRPVRSLIGGATDSTVLGEVASLGSDGLISIHPRDRELAKVGTMLDFGGFGTGVIISERCGMYFACSIGNTALPQVNSKVMLLSQNLTVPIDPEDSMLAAWGGIHDYMGVPMEGGAVTPNERVDVFREPVSAAQRRPIGTSLHTGIVAIEALAPIGRGQSMMLFGPDDLPAGSGRTDIALRLLTAQHTLSTDVKCILVLTGTSDERASTIRLLRESGALPSVKVLEAKTSLEGVVAASAACSIAESCLEHDVLVIVDSLRSHLQLWKEICSTLTDQGVAVSPEEEGSQQRAYYSRLVERAARRKDGGSVTLLLLQPSVSVLPDASSLKEAYTLADFEQSGFSKTVCARIKMLQDKGIALTQEVLVKVGIPLPGSDHPAAGAGQRSAQHLEELTSLVDGHIDLRESLAARGRVPPIDPSNSLTRIGVGSSKLRSLSMTPAMAAVCGPLRLELASAVGTVQSAA